MQPLGPVPGSVVSQPLKGYSVHMANEKHKFPSNILSQSHSWLIQKRGGKTIQQKSMQNQSSKETRAELVQIML